MTITHSAKERDTRQELNLPRVFSLTTPFGYAVPMHIISSIAIRSANYANPANFFIRVIRVIRG